MKGPFWAPAPKSDVEGLTPGPQGCRFHTSPGDFRALRTTVFLLIFLGRVSDSAGVSPSLRWPSLARTVFPAISCQPLLAFWPCLTAGVRSLELVPVTFVKQPLLGHVQELSGQVAEGGCASWALPGQVSVLPLLPPA